MFKDFSQCLPLGGVSGFDGVQDRVGGVIYLSAEGTGVGAVSFLEFLGKGLDSRVFTFIEEAGSNTHAVGIFTGQFDEFLGKHAADITNFTSLSFSVLLDERCGRE